MANSTNFTCTKRGRSRLFYHERPAYRQVQAVDGWQKSGRFLARHLDTPSPRLIYYQYRSQQCTMITQSVVIDSSGKGRDGWFEVDRAHVSYDHPFNASFEHASASLSMSLRVLGTCGGRTQCRSRPLAGDDDIECARRGPTAQAILTIQSKNSGTFMATTRRTWVLRARSEPYRKLRREILATTNAVRSLVTVRK